MGAASAIACWLQNIQRPFGKMFPWALVGAARKLPWSVTTENITELSSFNLKRSGDGFALGQWARADRVGAAWGLVRDIRRSLCGKPSHVPLSSFLR